MTRLLPYLGACALGAALGLAGAQIYASATLGHAWLPMDLAQRRAEIAEARGRQQERARAIAERLADLGADAAGAGPEALEATVVVTAYHPVRAQTDSTPWVTASNRPSRPGRTCAISRPLRARLGLRWGDIAIVPGRGAWVVEDLMAARIDAEAVDLMLPVGAPAFREHANVVFIRGAR